MKPPPFDYHAPDTLDDALALLAGLGDDAAILAGGQSLIPLLNLRLARPGVVVDIGRIPGLDGIEVTADAIRCGALVRAADLEHSRETTEALPCLGDALREIGHPQIRNRTTIGGNVAHADPASELPAVLLATDGEVTLRSAARGVRSVPAEDFFQSVYLTAREPDEMVTSVTFRRLPGRSTFLEIARRPGDFALAGACVALATDDGAVTDARVAVCGAGERAVRIRDAEVALVGGAASATAIGEAARTAGAGVEPLGDIAATAEYRAAMVEVLVARGLHRLSEGER